MKLHASDGADMLATVGNPEIAAMVRHHHERIDGRGYPDGLAGSEIPLGARIIAVADTFDAITSNRPYRPVDTHKKALDVLYRQAGSQLDDSAVAAFLSRYSARRSVAWFALAAALPQRIFAALQTVSPGIGASAGAATSLLPAIGTVGLLTFSPGLRDNRPIERSAHRQSGVTHHNSLPQVVSAIPTTHGARHDTRQTASIRLARPEHHRTRKTARIPASAPLGRPVSKSPHASAPSTFTAATATGTHEPVATEPIEPPTTSSPAPRTVPAPPPPPTLPTPPAEEAPALPKLPSLPGIPPVALPNLPAVSLPSVSNSITKAILGGKT